MPTLPYGTCVLAAARLPRGGSGRTIPVSCSKTRCGLHSTAYHAAAARCGRSCVSTSQGQFTRCYHSATPRPANFIMILRLGGHASRAIRSRTLQQTPRSSVIKLRHPAKTRASLGAAVARRFSDAPAYNDAPLAETVKMGAAASCVGSKEDPITSGDVEVAQEAWAKGIVDIGKVYQDKGD